MVFLLGPQTNHEKDKVIIYLLESMDNLLIVIKGYWLSLGQCNSTCQVSFKMLCLCMFVYDTAGFQPSRDRQLSSLSGESMPSSIVRILPNYMALHGLYKT